MLCIILIVFVFGPTQLSCVEENSSLRNISSVLMKSEENATSSTVKGENVYSSSTTKIISTPTTPSLLSGMPSSDTPQPVLPKEEDLQLATNITKVVKSDKFRNSSLGTGKSPERNGKINVVVTEGGNSVTTLDKTGTNFQAAPDNSKIIVAEGGVQESAGERISPNSTAIPAHSALDPHSPIMEGMSSMNEGKIIARKGVVLDNDTVSDEEQRAGEISKNNSITNGDLSHNRKPKPVLTDDNNPTVNEIVPKVDYVIAIVCSAFSLPLLIVLGMYLYKRGSDLWERRHYNRMDFLIEGMYND